MNSPWIMVLLVLVGATAACTPSVIEATETLEEANAAYIEAHPQRNLPADMSPYLDPLVPDYVIGPGDRISVEVAGVNELSRRGLLVRPDGKITLPLLQDTVVAGLSPERAAREIETRLLPTLPKAQVIVSLDEARSQRFLVLGAVQNPGIFPLSGPITVLEALGLAGGVALVGETGRALADLSRAYLVRGKSVVPLNFDRLIGGDYQHNVYIRPGDMLYIPARHAGEVFVLGEVQNPGVFEFVPNMSVMRALAAAGWVNRVAAKETAVRVIRGALAAPHVYLIDAEDIAAGRRNDVAIRPGDIVFVTTTELQDWNDVLGQLLPTLQAAVSARYLIGAADGIIFQGE
ncbi:MAG: polysaccharide biosynthesis/export family protein [Myxococcales bacterium]|nr:polysaccharide biosynthesis/export family protein [Myxococcales bacterium]